MSASLAIWDNKDLSRLKFQAFQQLRQLRPRARFLYFGDSGQADIDTGLKIMQSLAAAADGKSDGKGDGKDQPAPLLPALFINDIIASWRHSRPKCDQKLRDSYRKHNVLIMDSYLDGASSSRLCQLFECHVSCVACLQRPRSVASTST